MNELETTPVNPFANAPVVARSSHSHAPKVGGLVAVEQQRTFAEIQAAITLARMNPRDPVVAMDRIMNACARPGLAEAGLYHYSRGGTPIDGPSIRLAEALAQSWGNIKTSVQELEQTAEGSTVRAQAWDLETGYHCEKIFQVPHVRTGKNKTRLEDPRDIYENVANNAARRLRACILAVIPGDVIEAAVAQCEVTLKSTADTSPAAMKKMVEHFASYGVTKEQIEKRIQRRVDAILPAQVMGLKKIAASMRDGMSVAADWFDVDAVQQAQAEPATRAEQVKAKLRKAAPPTMPHADNPATGAPPAFVPSEQTPQPSDVPAGDPKQPMPRDAD